MYGLLSNVSMRNLFSRPVNTLGSIYTSVSLKRCLAYLSMMRFSQKVLCVDTAVFATFFPSTLKRTNADTLWKSTTTILALTDKIWATNF